MLHTMFPSVLLVFSAAGVECAFELFVQGARNVQHGHMDMIDMHTANNERAHRPTPRHTQRVSILECRRWRFIHLTTTDLFD